MAIYRSEDLLERIKILSQIGPGTKPFRVKQHLKTEGPHGTDNCYYCNDLAKDLGLLPEPIQ